MFGIRLKGIYFGVSFSFFAVMFWLFTFIESRQSIFLALICCIFHELGHITAMFLFSRRPERVLIYGGGIRIVPACRSACADTKDIIILLAGCTANFLLAGVEIFRTGLDTFAEMNLMLGCFNLLPFGYFDGGRVLRLLMSGKALTVIKVIFTLLITIFIIIMLARRLLNISLAVTFLIVVIFELMNKRTDINLTV